MISVHVHVSMHLCKYRYCNFIVASEIIVSLLSLSLSPSHSAIQDMPLPK